MTQYSTPELQSFPGRSWLFPDGTCQVLSTAHRIREIGISHKQVVWERCRRLVASAAGLEIDRNHWSGVLSATGGQLSPEQLERSGLHPDVVTIANQLNWNDGSLGDIRLWAAKHWGWTRQGGAILETWGLTPDKLRAISKALRCVAEQLTDRGHLELQLFEIHDLATGEAHHRVSFQQLESGVPLHTSES